MPSSGETVQEIKFWSDLEAEIHHIDEQLHSQEAECTLTILKQGKRFITTVSFDTDTVGLRKALDVGKPSANRKTRVRTHFSLTLCFL
jgi:hypothetical protein